MHRVRNKTQKDVDSIIYKPNRGRDWGSKGQGRGINYQVLDINAVQILWNDIIFGNVFTPILTIQSRRGEKC